MTVPHRTPTVARTTAPTGRHATDPTTDAVTDPDQMRSRLLRLDHPVYVVGTERGPGISMAVPPGLHPLATLEPLPTQALGSPAFRAAHRVDTAYMAGGMASGVSSVELVTAAARAGFLAAFGAGGLPADEVARSLARLAAHLPTQPYAVNVLHTPNEPALERAVVDLCLRHQVRCVEASAYLDLTPHLVRYRVSGLHRGPDGRPRPTHRVIAKASRPEVCRHFFRPPPEAVVRDLLDRGHITADQAELARSVTMADDLTVEGDSAGHTDRRPLSALLPVLVRQRDQAHLLLPQAPAVRLGAAGGIGTPQAVGAAFAMGADYVVTGSVNQSCVEAGTAERVRLLLAGAEISDFDMAPSGYMFELGAQVQVLRKGTMFPQRARRLRQLYEAHDGLDDLPPRDRDWLEGQVLRAPIAAVWADVVSYFSARDPDLVARAEDDPKRRMALTFRWYLGRSSRWALSGTVDRAVDYQIWAGPALGSFNDWVKDSHLADPAQRRIADVARHLLRGAAFHTRLAAVRRAGVTLPARCLHYQPKPVP